MSTSWWCAQFAERSGDVKDMPSGIIEPHLRLNEISTFSRFRLYIAFIGSRRDFNSNFCSTYRIGTNTIADAHQATIPRHASLPQALPARTIPRVFLASFGHACPMRESESPLCLSESLLLYALFSPADWAHSCKADRPERCGASMAAILSFIWTLLIVNASFY